MKINCPFHKDDTASLQIYDDTYHCFGCAAHGSVKQLEALTSTNYYTFVQRYAKQKSQEKENIAEKLAIIRNLPKKLIRGFELPYDNIGYYIIYPDNKYYIKRVWEGDNANKYRSPIGHRKPLYIETAGAGLDYDTTIYVIEGQLNAKTFGRYNGEVCVSPGAATDLTRKDFIDYYAKYDNIVFVVDADAAGVINAIKAREKLLPLKKRVSIYPMQTDLNDLYVKDPATAEAEVKKILDLSQV